LPAFNIAESNHDHAFATTAFELDTAGYDLREQVAAFTAMRGEVAGFNGPLHLKSPLRTRPS